jgi:hypothetical protein
MRGTTSRQVTMLGVIDPEQLIPADHPIRRIRPLVEAALVDLEPTFERMYAEIGLRMSSQKGTTVIAQKGTTWERKRSQ